MMTTPLTPRSATLLPRSLPAASEGSTSRAPRSWTTTRRSDAAASLDPSAGLEMWDFQDEFDDMRGVKDPLEQENNRGRKGQKKKKKKKGGKEAGAK